jgi:hypothetical protein
MRISLDRVESLRCMESRFVDSFFRGSNADVRIDGAVFTSLHDQFRGV